MQQANPLQNQGLPTSPSEHNDAKPRRQVSQSLFRGLIGILVFNGLLCLILLCRPIPREWRALVDNLAGSVGPLLALPWCFWGGRSDFASADLPVKKRRIRTPVLLGLGVLSFAIGQAVWTYYEHILHQKTPFPSWSDAGFLMAYPFLFAGILALPASRLPIAARTRIFLDSLMIMTAVVTFSWYFLLGPTLRTGAETLLGKILGAAYPFADLVMFCCVLLLSMRALSPTMRRAANLLSLGLLSIILVDTVFGYQTLHNTYATGGLVDVCWPLGYMLIGLAGRAVRLSSLSPNQVPASPVSFEADRSEETNLWSLFLPYLLIPAVGLLVFSTTRIRGDEALEAGVHLGAALLIGVLLIRQVFAILENARLNRDLREIYQELEVRNRQEIEYARRMEAMNKELCAMQADLVSNNLALREAKERWENLATIDAMTGIANHRAFQEHLHREISREQRHSSPLTLLMMDVDEFKRYNDSFGHPAGDEVLRKVAQILRDSVREGDIVARYGGEEFVALLPQTDAAQGRVIAERIRKAVEAHDFDFRPVTLSIGLAQYRLEEEKEALLARADQALYLAKRTGRNRVAGSADTPVSIDR